MLRGTLAPDAAPRAPRQPRQRRPRGRRAGAGIYCFLDADEELLYVGKAGDLRARLRAHARRPSGFVYDDVAEVRWEEHVDEHAAVCREADLIVALRPRLNAAHVDDGRWVFIVVDDDGLTLETEPRGRCYGCFPHLGRGVASQPAIACSDGYVALLRLLWAASTEAPIPSVITRSAPDAFGIRVDATVLHPVLAGTSALAAALDDVRSSPALRAAGVGAGSRRSDGLLHHGPAAIRRLRLAHGMPRGPVDASTIRAALAGELRSSIGSFKVRGTDAPRGRRTREWVSPPGAPSGA